MQLSQTVEYALRAVTYMATLPEGEYVTATDVSDAAQIPVHYLSKILRRMVRKGILISQKGHGGGFTLVRPLTTIRVLDVLLAVDYSFEPDHCVWGWKSCGQSKPCPLHRSWVEVKEAFMTWAKKTTVEDLKSGGSILEHTA